MLPEILLHLKSGVGVVDISSEECEDAQSPAAENSHWGAVHQPQCWGTKWRGEPGTEHMVTFLPPMTSASFSCLQRLMALPQSFQLEESVLFKEHAR